MIDTFFNILRKVMMAVVIGVFTLALVYVPQPTTDGGYHNVEVAEAGGAFVDPVNLVQNTLTAIQTAAQWVIDQWILLKEQVLDSVAWVFAKEILADMTSSIVDWVNSGFKGSPTFVQDLEGYLQEASDRETSRFLAGLLGPDSFLCEPFQFEVSLGIAIQADIDRERRQVDCSLDDIFAGNVADFEDFLSGDFQKGGWEGWFTMVGNPNNTPYGAALAAQSNLRAEQAAAQARDNQELANADGMRSIKECTNTPDPNAPGGIREDCYVTTPGGVIFEQLNKALGSGQEQLVAADEFNEIVGVLIARLASTVLSPGSSLLDQGGGAGFDRYSRATSFEDDVEAVIGATGDITFGGGGGSSGALGGGGLGDGGSGAGANFINNTMAALPGMRTTVNDYIAKFNSFIANGNNDEEDVLAAESQLTIAENYLNRITNAQAAGTPIQNEYNLLEAEYPGASPARQQQILNRQTVLVQQFTALTPPVPAELNSLVPPWDRLLDENQPPAFCGFAPLAPGCPCTFDPTLPACP